MRVQIRVNRRLVEVSAPDDTPLLWVLRDHLGLTGPKYGCGIGACGACTSLRAGQPIRTCVVSLAEVGDAEITTIEGLSDNGDHPVQQAWKELDVPQCGYCQAGQIMTTVALLARNPHPTDEDIDEALSGQVCRCGTYQRIRAAVHRAAELAEEER